MKQYTNSIYLISLFCLFFFSCEWDNNDKNYIELEKPQDITMGIDLAGVREDEVIYIYNNTNLFYSLSTQGKALLQVNLYLDGNSIGSDISKIHLSVNQINDEEHDLKVVIVLRSGSGSVADFANLEQYIGEYNFKIKFVDQNSTENRLKVSQTIDENNYLKLTWDEPTLPVDRYDVYSKTWNGDEKLIGTINDPTQNWCVDKNYVYGFQQYRVAAHVSNSSDVYLEGFHTVEYTTINEDNFKVEIQGLNKAELLFNNPNPYPFCLVVKDKLGNIYKMRDGNRVSFSKSLFPVYNELLRLYLLPANNEEADYLNFDNYYFYFSDEILTGIPNVTTVDVVKKQLIGSNFSSFYVYDKNLNAINNATIHYNLSTGSQINSLTNGLVAIQDINYFLHIYSDNTLNRELYALPLNYTDHFVTGKDKIAVTDPVNNTLSVYEGATAIKLFTNNYGGEQDYSRWFSPFLSYDDKYIAVLNYNFNTRLAWYKIYEMQGNTLTEKKSEINVPVNNIVFNYNNPNEVFICYSTRFDIVDLTTMQTKKSITGAFRDVDILTGNLLYKVNSTTGSLTNQYKILDSNYTDEILSFSTGNQSGARLFNSYFMINNYFIHTDKIKNQ